VTATLDRETNRIHPEAVPDTGPFQLRLAGANGSGVRPCAPLATGARPSV